MEKSRLVKEVIAYLRARPGKIISHRDLYQAVWGVAPAAGFLNTLRSTISLARLELEPDRIHSVYRVGYFYLEEKLNEQETTRTILV